MTPNGRSLLLSENSLFSYLFWRTFIFVLKNTFICSEEPICSEENSYLFWRTPPWFQLDLSPAVWRSDIAMGQIYFTIDSGQKKINNDTQGHCWINTHTGKYSRVLSKLPERIKIITSLWSSWHLHWITDQWDHYFNLIVRTDRHIDSVTITAFNLTICFISLSFNISDQEIFNISLIFLINISDQYFWSIFLINIPDQQFWPSTSLVVLQNIFFSPSVLWRSIPKLIAPQCYLQQTNHEEKIERGWKL